MLSLIRFLREGGGTTMLLAAASSLLGGASAAGLIAIINRALHLDAPPSGTLVAAFAGLLLLRFFTGTAAQILLSQHSQRAVSRLRATLGRRILSTPLVRLETIGIARLLAVLTSDVHTLELAFRIVPRLMANAAVLLGCAVYLGWLSPVTLGLTTITLGLGTGLYWLISKGAFTRLKVARRALDDLHQCFRDLTEGVHQLKLHRGRRNAFLDQALGHTTERLRVAWVAAATRFAFAHGFSQLLFFALIGWVVLGLPGLSDADNAAVTGYALAMLFMLGPMAALTQVAPTLVPAQIALARIEGLDLEPGPMVAAPAPVDPHPSWNRLALRGVTFRYPEQHRERAFELGPIDLDIRAGEVLVIAGGNGSGKSTLAKLLVGLYPPAAGHIELDGERIDDAHRERYREHFTALLGTFHLFDRPLGLEVENVDTSALLDRLGLDTVVDLGPGGWSSLDLSAGQRKRLALLVAYLEDRPIYVFDEWAADQDPAFKRTFYEELLPDLAARGKAVIAISHDDRWFGIAERIIELEDGRIREANQPSPHADHPSPNSDFPSP